MNLYGAYKKLLSNSKQAMFSAIEIYNKPKFDYREEVFVILLVNAWDLLLLAILSKNKKRIFQKKKKGQPYKTLKFDTSYSEASKFFVSLEQKDIQAIKTNLSLIRDYRNKAIHYYGDKPKQHVIYVLSQSAIKNYFDAFKSIFNEDLINEINIILLPLSFNNQPRFIEFFKQNKSKGNSFVQSLFKNLKELEDIDADTSLFITQCSVKIESSRSIKSSDFNSVYDEKSNAVAIKTMDPDDSYPFLRKDIIGGKKNPKHSNLKKELNQYDFQAIVFVDKLKESKKYCWQSKKGGSPRYSYEVIEFLNKITDLQIQKARKLYGERKNKS